MPYEVHTPVFEGDLELLDRELLTSLQDLGAAGISLVKQLATIDSGHDAQQQAGLAVAAVLLFLAVAASADDVAWLQRRAQRKICAPLPPAATTSPPTCRCCASRTRRGWWGPCASRSVVAAQSSGSAPIASLCAITTFETFMTRSTYDGVLL